MFIYNYLFRMNKKQKIIVDKHKLFNDFLEENKNLPEQGSNEWLDYKTYKIGGSEIGVIIGQNKYQTKKDLVKSHVGLKKFPSFHILHWGTVYEDALRNHVETIYKCNIVETGSIQHKKHEYISYSPDGIAIIKTEHIQHLMPDNIICHDDSIVLFEYKCPYSRVPTGEVPEHYVSQPKLGMDTIDICDTSIFIEAVYKLSSYGDLIYNNVYNMGYHKDKVQLYNNPITYGILIIYYDNSEVNNEDISLEDMIDNDLDDSTLIDEINLNIKQLNYSIEMNVKDKVINDLSSIRTPYIINKVLAGCACKERKCFKIDYSMQYIYNQNQFDNPNKYITKFNNNNIQSNLTCKLYETIDKLEKDNKKIFGILPYKLFNLFINPIQKDKDLLNPEVLNEISRIMDIIKLCKDKDMDEKNIIIDQHFKKTKKTKKN